MKAVYPTQRSGIVRSLSVPYGQKQPLRRLEGAMADQAWHLWKYNNHDTAEIARLLKRPEAEVFNTIRARREYERDRRAKGRG